MSEYFSGSLSSNLNLLQEMYRTLPVVKFKAPTVKRKTATQSHNHNCKEAILEREVHQLLSEYITDTVEIQSWNTGSFEALSYFGTMTGFFDSQHMKKDLKKVGCSLNRQDALQVAIVVQRRIRFALVG